MGSGQSLNNAARCSRPLRFRLSDGSDFKLGDASRWDCGLDCEAKAFSHS